MDMDGDWRLPLPNTLFKKHRRPVRASAASRSISGTFARLAKPVVAEAVQRTRALALEGDAEGFHQLRVAFRKLRALYWAYSPYLGEAVTVEATGEFRRLAAVAGGTRDWDIATGLLEVAQTSHEPVQLLVTAARTRRAQAMMHSQALLAGDDVEAFLNQVLVRAQTTLEQQCDGLPVRPFAKKRVRLARRALKKRSRKATRSEPVVEEALHDVRKAGKKLRYLLEFFQPVLKRRHGRTIKSLTSVQNKLGEFNDIAASEALIRSTEFSDVPAAVVDESLAWLDEQKGRLMAVAARRVAEVAS